MAENVIAATPVPFVDLSRSHEPLADQIDEAIAEVRGRGDFILGEAVERFERRFADYVGVDHAIGVGSGTAALAIALRASGIGPGDEVIVPAHTYIATALAVVHAGAEPVFCDVEAATGLIDVDSAAAVVGSRTAAIVPVHLYGQVAALEPLAELAGAHDLLLLEDSAQAHGARVGARLAGSLGDVSAFSFYPSKNLGAFGDGGMVCTDDAGIADLARRLRNLGQAEKGVHSEVGFNERLDTIQAAVLDAKLDHLDGWNGSRRQAAAWYREHLPDCVCCLPERVDVEDVFHLFPIRVPGGSPDRDGVAAALADRGIGTGVHYSPAVHQQPPFATAGSAVPLAEAEAWAAEELSLPMFPGITEEEVGAVCTALGQVLGESAGARAVG